MMDRPRVLVADDDRLMREVLRDVLDKAGYQTVLCASGREALTASHKKRFELAVIDVVMPEMDGYELCRRIREKSQMPIVMLTVLNDTESVVRGLEVGADDYVVKPFRPREFLARLSALQRRVGHTPDHRAPLVAIGELKIDRKRHRVFVDQREVILSPTEFELLSCLASSPGEVFDRETLLPRVWGTEYTDETKMVDVCIRRLRQKLEPDPSAPTFVLTVRGIGYSLAEENGAAPHIDEDDEDE